VTPSLTIAFLAGILSFLSPCVLPLVPSYLAYVGGGATTRSVTLRNSLLFIAGFSLIFVALGASASFLGSFLLEYRAWLIRLGGALIITFGLMLLGAFRLGFLYRSAKVTYRGSTSTPVGAGLLGMSFGIGWTPCVGPVLGAILTLAGTSGSMTQGTALLSVYALGLAIPFLLAALGVGAFTRFSKRFAAYFPWVERLSGAILTVAGILMVSGYYTRLNTVLIRLTPPWLLEWL
jgi:cytochrome c-type biogenesis protein